MLAKLIVAISFVSMV